jgi:hypothetical protein
MSMGMDEITHFQDRYLQQSQQPHLESSETVSTERVRTSWKKHFLQRKRSTENKRSMQTNIKPDLPKNKGVLTPITDEKMRVCLANRDNLQRTGSREMKSNWHEIVEEYTSRTLSRHSDRLAALQGIADAVQQTTQGTYVAGF